MTSFIHESGVAVPTLCAAFQQTASLRPAAVALRTADGSLEVTWATYAARVHSIAAGLANLGVRRGDTVALMLANRPEFQLVDTAALHLGATPFSVYNTSSPEQITHLLGNAGTDVIVTERALMSNVLKAEHLPAHIVCVDGPAAGATLTLAELEAAGDADFDLEPAWRTVDPDDVATIIYTSGTTGPPKGVELTHRSLLAVLHSAKDLMDTGAADRMLSYLPAAHAAERVAGYYQAIVFGLQMTSVADAKELPAALSDARPTLFFAVPRVWQKFKAAIQMKVAAETGIKKALALWALGVACEAGSIRMANQKLPLAVSLQYQVADALVLGKLRQALGLDRVRWAASGAAAIPVDTLKFFHGIGIPVCEVWGMSETSALATAVRSNKMRAGTVGQAVLGVELKLLDDGELLYRGPMLMRGYRNDPQQTAAVIDSDGWLHTGDIATIDGEGVVTIVDRKKELIINEAGKNMSPTNIENAVTASSPLVGTVVAIGEARPYITALITLAAEMLADRGPADSAVTQEITDAVQAANRTLSRVEQIKRFVIVDDAWEPGGDELTPTMKLKRKPIAAKYAELIEELYAAVPDARVVNL